MSDDRFYTMMSDDDGHRYVVPVDKLGEAHEYFDKVYAFWDRGEGELPEDPDWLEETGGGLVVFKHYEIRQEL